MFSEIQIKNFKSIHDLTLKPGRVTVLIGENGSGKSNILEAIAFAAGAAADRLDNEYLVNRGIRVTEPEWMQAAFPIDETASSNVKFRNIHLALLAENKKRFASDIAWTSGKEKEKPDQWKIESPRFGFSDSEVDAALNADSFSRSLVEDVLTDLESDIPKEQVRTPVMRKMVAERVLYRTWLEESGLMNFLIYAPENSYLRSMKPEGAIQPLGTKGEGLLKFLQTFPRKELASLTEHLHLFGWFADLDIPDERSRLLVEMGVGVADLRLRDKWLTSDHSTFDQRSANEGFLYVLFYFALLMSKRTPKFFALDNVDNALNPRLCAELMKQIAELAKKYDKQVICTTHNPALLDGLDLKDDEQRLFTVSRSSDGHTRVRRVHAPEPQPGEEPVRLSVAFLRGLIGGLPKNF